MSFKKLFIGFIALLIFSNLSFSDKQSELKFRLHKVKKGDTLWKLCKYDWEIAARINNVDPNNLRVGSLLVVASNWGLSGESFNRQLILIEIKERTLKFFEDGKLRMEYPIRVGKKETPTPIGTGVVYIKRERPVFRWTEGPKKGEIIIYDRLEDGRLIKIPYKDMRSLGLFICNSIKYAIHSTTEEHTIGRAASMGCIGMRIKDMLLLYPQVKTGARIVIKF